MTTENTLLLIVTAIIMVVLSTLALTGLMPEYSEGVRVGVVDKISHKGVFNKSYEGQMKMRGQLVETVFPFSVRDPKVAQQLVEASASGRTVQVTYQQWLVNPSCYQSTSYTVIAVK